MKSTRMFVESMEDPRAWFSEESHVWREDVDRRVGHGCDAADQFRSGRRQHPSQRECGTRREKIWSEHIRYNAGFGAPRLQTISAQNRGDVEDQQHRQ